MSSPGLNEASLAEAQRRYRRINRWFLVCWVLMPLGIILPCILSIITYQIWGDEVSAPIGLSALLWPLVGLAGVLLLRGGRKRAKRMLALARLGDSLGFKFTCYPTSEQYAFMKSVSFVENSHLQTAQNLMEGDQGRWPMTALDFEYTFFWGSVTEIGSQTIAAFHSGFESLPALAVVPISTMGRIENMLLGKGNAIRFPHHPEFNARFAVLSADEANILALISPALIDLLLADRLLTLVVEQGRLLVFRRLTYVRAEDYRQFLGQAYRAAELLSPR